MAPGDRKFAEWLFRPAPFEDELLSSWLTRIVYFHCYGFFEFCEGEWPGERWHYHDIDVTAPYRLLKGLADNTVASPHQTFNSTLRSYEGMLFPKALSGGKSRFILPAGANPRKVFSAGMQWCPLCLDCDETPYWRKTWRIAFVTVCTEHKIVLADRCSHCGFGAIPRRRADLRCYNCLEDYRSHPHQPAYTEVQKFQEKLEELLLDPSSYQKTHKDGEENISDYFRAIWHLLRFVMVSREAVGLCEEIDKRFSFKMRAPSRSLKLAWRLEAEGVNERHRGMRRAATVQGNNHLLVMLCRSAGINWAKISRGTEFTPFPPVLLNALSDGLRERPVSVVS